MNEHENLTQPRRCVCFGCGGGGLPVVVFAIHNTTTQSNTGSETNTVLHVELEVKIAREALERIEAVLLLVTALVLEHFLASIVFTALLWVRQHLVCLRDVLKLLFRGLFLGFLHARDSKSVNTLTPPLKLLSLHQSVALTSVTLSG
jgi:hypothetical protein